jgi:hypothetical protein
MAPNEELNTPSELLEESQQQAYYCRGLPQARHRSPFGSLISSSVGNRPNECLFGVWEER